MSAMLLHSMQKYHTKELADGVLKEVARWSESLPPVVNGCRTKRWSGSVKLSRLPWRDGRLPTG